MMTERVSRAVEVVANDHYLHLAWSMTGGRHQALFTMCHGTPARLPEEESDDRPTCLNCVEMRKIGEDFRDG